MTNLFSTTIFLDPPWPVDPAAALEFERPPQKTNLNISTRKPRKPTLVSVARQANKAAIAVARYEVKPDGTVVVVTGEPEPAEPDNPWPLDEFRTKETKQ